MAAIATTPFRVFNARKFIESTDKYFMFIGRPQAWASDTSPDNPKDTVQERLFIYDDIIAAKQVTSNERSSGIVRRNWTSGQFYNMYRHDYDGTITVRTLGGSSFSPTTLEEANYYVVTANYNVYMCLFAPDTASTVNPQGFGTNSYAPISAADGYKWLFICKAASAEITKFLTNDYCPVKTIAANPGSGHEDYTSWEAQENAITNAGCVYVVVISAAGSGYGNGTTGIPITVKGDGTGFAATATANSSGNISSIVISDYGTGYSWMTLSVGGTGNSCVLYPIITPSGGLGADPVRDLSAVYSIINARFEYAEGNGIFPVTNDYRRIGLLINPLQYGTTDLITATTASNCITMELTGVSGGSITVDSVIKDDTTKAAGIIVDVVAGATTVVKVIRTPTENAIGDAAPQNSFVDGNTVSIGVITATIDSITNPDIEPDSGYIFYYENRKPISRSDNQIEDVKIVFEF